MLRILEEVAAAPQLRTSLLLAGAAPLLQALATSSGCFAQDARRILHKLQQSTTSASSHASSSGGSVSSGITVASGGGGGSGGGTAGEEGRGGGEG